MQTFLFLLGIVTLVVLVEGMINPRMVIRWGEVKTRGKVLMVYGSLFVVLFVAFIAAAPANETAPTTAVPQKTEQQKAEKVSEPAAKLDKKLDFTAARKRVTDWLGKHQFLQYTQITLRPIMFKGEMYKLNGTEYFLFTIEGLPREADVLVDPTTGEMFFHDVGVTQPLDKWFISWIKDHKGGNTQQQAPANVRINKDFEWVEMPTTQGKYIVGKVRNISNTNFKNVYIEFNAYDASGNQLGSLASQVRNLKPNAVWNFRVPVHLNNVASYDLQGVDGYI